MRGTLILFAVGCSTSHPSSPDARATGDAAAIDAVPGIPMQATFDQLDADVGAQSPGTDLALAYLDLATGETAQLRGDELHVSASSAKAWWVAAALDGAGLDAVTPHAQPIFANSDNVEAGAVIDLIGIDAVNTWTSNVAGMSNTALTQWSYGGTRVATNSPRAMGDDNYTTANDAVRFLGRLAHRELLGDDRGTTLRTWLTWSPNSGIGGGLVARLPAAIQDAVEHKAGWLPPGCCGDDTYYNTQNEIGIVTAGDGRAYAVAILAHGGTDYTGAQQPFVERASCEIYRAFVADPSIDCGT